MRNLRKRAIKSYQKVAENKARRYRLEREIMADKAAKRICKMFSVPRKTVAAVAISDIEANIRINYEPFLFSVKRPNCTAKQQELAVRLIAQCNHCGITKTSWEITGLSGLGYVLERPEAWSDHTCPDHFNDKAQHRYPESAISHPLGTHSHIRALSKHNNGLRMILPITWVRRHNLSQNSEVHVSTNNNGNLIIRPKRN